MATEPVDDTQLMCPACGYNLSGITRDVCPECGKRFVLVQPSLVEAEPDDPTDRTASAQIATVLILAGVVSVLLVYYRNAPTFVVWIGGAIALIGVFMRGGMIVLPTRKRDDTDNDDDLLADGDCDVELPIEFSFETAPETIQLAVRYHIWRTYHWGLIVMPLLTALSVGMYLTIPDASPILLLFAGVTGFWSYSFVQVFRHTTRLAHLHRSSSADICRLHRDYLEVESDDQLLRNSWSNLTLWRTDRSWIFRDSAGIALRVIPTGPLTPEVRRFILKQLAAHGGTIE